MPSDLINKKNIVKKRLDKYFKVPFVKKYSPLIKNLSGTISNAGNTGYGSSFGRYNQAIASLGFNPMIDRFERMSEYSVMDYNAEIYAALDIYCLAENTVIPTLDGKLYTIKELSKKEKPFYVYSSDGKNIVPAKCISAHITGKNQPVYKVILDDGTEIEATNFHKFMMRNGEYKKLKDLQVGDSLMPLYKRISSIADGDRITGYEMIYLSDNKKWEYTHELVKKEFLGNEKGVCHHIDFNKTNNIPENIKIMSWLDHQLYHLYDINLYNDIIRFISVIKNRSKNIISKFIHKTFIKNINKKFIKDNSKLVYYNHKVVSIEFSRYVDVYDLTVEKYHNFAVGDGKNGYVIVHNSDDATTKFIDGNVMKINTSDESIKTLLDELYFGILNINFNLWGWVRDTLKYGDNFLLLDLNVGDGIGGILPLSVYEVERVEDVFDEENPVKFILNNNVNREFNIYEIVHFRMFGDMAYKPYGCSILEPCRRYWRQSNMLEDAMIIYRIMRCLHGDSQVWTENGYKKIKDIKVGDKVYSYNKNNNKLMLTEVTNWINNGSQKIWEISSTHRTIKANENHPILVRDNVTNKIDYIKVKDLIPKRHQFVMPTLENEEINVPIKLKKENYEWFGCLSEEGKQYYKKLKFEVSKLQIEKELAIEFKYSKKRIHQFFNIFNKVKGIPYEISLQICNKLDIPLKYLIKYPKQMFNLERINVPEFVDEEFARFFGFMIGNGYMGKNMHDIGFATGIYPEVNEYYANILKKYVSSAIFYHDERNENENLGRYSVNSFYFSHLMKDLGFTSSVYTKKIPDWIFTSSNKIKEAFIDGLMDADGHRRKQRNTESMEIELCNKNIIEGLKELAHQLGWNVSSKIYVHNRKGDREINGYKVKSTTSYGLYLTKVKTNLYENIIDIKETDEYSDVYDIKVKSRLSNFIADGCVVHNSPERRVIYVDVANLPPEAVEGYVSDVISNMKNTPIDTNNSGNFDYRLNVMSMMDDYVIPVRGKESGTRIDTLKSAKSLTDMEDIRYIQNKLVTSLKVPKRYLGLDNETNTDLKNAAAQEDIRFSRTIERIQNMIVSELKKIGVIHLILKGISPEKADLFEIELKNPSSASEVEKLEVIKEKFSIAADILEGKLADRQWVYDNILQFTDDEIKLINDGLIKDFKYMSFVNAFAKTASKKYEQEFEKKFNVEKPEDALAGQMGGAPGGIPADAAADDENVDVQRDFKNMNIGGGNSVATRLGAKSPTSTILRPYESKNQSLDKISKNNKLIQESSKKNLLLEKLLKENEDVIDELNEIKEKFNLD